MGTVAIDTCVFGNLNRANSAPWVAQTLRKIQPGNKLVVPNSVYVEIMNTPEGPLKAAQLQQIQDFNMTVLPEVAHQEYVGTYKLWAELKTQAQLVSYKDMKVIADVRAYAATHPGETVELFTVEKMVTNRQAISQTYGVKFNDNCYLESRTGNVIPYDPVALGVQEEAPAPPADPIPSAPETPLPNPGPGATETFLSTTKGALIDGLKGLLSAETGVGVAATVFMAACDMVAMKTAIRRIQVKFLKEGFAKGVAAGAMGWTSAETASNALNRVTNFRLQGLADPAGYLKLDYMYKLAESLENYAVGYGFNFGSGRALDWKKDWCAKGFGLLAKYGYNFGDDDDVLFTYEVLAKLAWAMRADSDAIVEPAIQFTGSKPRPAHVKVNRV